MADEILQRLDRIEATLSDLVSRTDRVETTLVSISERLARQVAVTEALRSDVRMLTSLARGLFTAMQGLAGAYADLSIRVTDLENPEPRS